MTDHRPWSLPDEEWRWRQSWLDLAFMHYRVEREKLEKWVPRGIGVQEFDGSSWVGVVPFRMAGVMRRPLPDVPMFSSFLELNLRTYVEVDGRPGVWFFSLDASSLPMVLGGRVIYGLPYFRARMAMKATDDWYAFSSVRRDGGGKFDARYRPIGDVYFPEAGTFEHWSAERYCLYSFSRSRGIERVEVHHAPWPLQKAEVVIGENRVISTAGIESMAGDPVCHFSKGVHVISYEKKRVGGGSFAVGCSGI